MVDIKANWSSHREAVALFRSADALIDAADTLQSHGVDRARLSILGVGTQKEAEALEHAGFRTVRDILSAPDIPRIAYVQPEDVTTARAAVVSTSIYVGATLGAAIASAVSAPVLAPIVAAAVASGAAAGGAGAFLVHRLGGGRPETYVKESIAHGGLVLWVLLRNDEPEIMHILRKAGGKEIRVQQVPSADRVTAADGRY